MEDPDDHSPFDGRPTTRQHPLKEVLGPVADGADRLLERLREIHGEPRPDIAPELVIASAREAKRTARK